MVASQSRVYGPTEFVSGVIGRVIELEWVKTGRSLKRKRCCVVLSSGSYTCRRGKGMCANRIQCTVVLPQSPQGARRHQHSYRLYWWRSAHYGYQRHHRNTQAPSHFRERRAVTRGCAASLTTQGTATLSCLSAISLRCPCFACRRNAAWAGA
jgi:hypothetical protein